MAAEQVNKSGESPFAIETPNGPLITIQPDYSAELKAGTPPWIAAQNSKYLVVGVPAGDLIDQEGDEPDRLANAIANLIADTLSFTSERREIMQALVRTELCERRRTAALRDHG